MGDLLRTTDLAPLPPDSPQPGYTASATISRRVAFDRLHGFPRLFQRYAAGDPAALEFFEYDWREPASRVAAARRATAIERDRETLADVLRGQNDAWGNDSPDVAANIDALRETQTTAVVTGQQLGLFGGPLYTIYKALTAVQLAHRAQQETGHPVVPIFWLADEDHGWEEARTAILVQANRPVNLALPPDGDRNPVGRRVLGGEVELLFSDLDETLSPTEHTSDLMKSLRAIYLRGDCVRDVFARLMTLLFEGTGLVLMSGDDARLKRIAAPVFRREIEDPSASLEALLEASRDLDAAGFHRQVTPLPGNLFLLDDEGRFSLDPQSDGSFALRGTTRTYTREDLLALLDREPERFSANVVLRPIVEDLLFPTMAYVAGPGEASYYAQIRGMYDRFGVPMPIVYPRASVTLVEFKVRRVLDRLDLEIEDFGNGSEEVVEALHRRLALSASTAGIEEAFSVARERLSEIVDEVAPVAVSVDPTLARSSESVRVRLLKDLESLEKKAVRAEKRNHAQIREQLEKAVAHLVPLGKPQERVLSPVHFANRYGPGFVTDLLDRLSLDTGDHQVLEV